MKIAHVTPAYPPYFGGMGNVAAEYVQAQRTQGDDVAVFHPNNTQTFFSFGNAAIMPVLLWHLRGYDVIHLHYPFYGAALFTALAARLRGQRFIVTYHMLTQSDDWRGWIFKLYRFFVEPFVLRLADAVLCSSDDYAQSIHLRHRELVEMPFWIDAHRFFPGDEEQLRAQIGAMKDTCVFLFVGGLDDAHDFKGLSLLLKAISEFAPKKDWQLVVVGDGNKRCAFETEAEVLSITERVTFAGRVESDQLPRYYRAADVHVFPSIHQGEAFGLVTLEAATSGVPSIVSDLPGVRTLIEPGKTGKLITPREVGSLKGAMEWMMNHPSLRQNMGAQAAERAKRYNKLRLLKRLYQIYKGIKVDV